MHGQLRYVTAMMSSRLRAIFLVFGFLVVIAFLRVAYYHESGSLTTHFGKKAALVYFSGSNSAQTAQMPFIMTLVRIDTFSLDRMLR